MRSVVDPGRTHAIHIAFDRVDPRVTDLADAFVVLQDARHRADYDSLYLPTKSLTLVHVEQAADAVAEYGEVTDMRIGIPTEVKDHEYRVAITPAGVHALVGRGHTVTVQAGAGLGAGITDTDYADVGAHVIADAAEVWGQAEMVIKVKEPVPDEYHLLRRDLVLFTYLHLAADRALTETLLAAGTTTIAYETVADDDGNLPLLAPMSEIAGRLATQVGADCLLRPHGGAGLLLGGAAGVRRGNVVVLGGGTVGTAAARVAAGMGADVTVYDVDPARMRQIEETSGGRIRTRYSTPLDVEAACLGADLVIGAVLVAGERTPHLVSHELVTRMRPGAVLVDVAIDQGGCFEDSRPTTHSEPTFEVEGRVMYCVANMPGAVPQTSTYALTNATLPYVLALADAGWREACQSRRDLARGVSTHDGALYTPGAGQALGLPVADVCALLA
nr:alanine dehydrogenase [Actinomyces trachealis]